MSEFFTKNRKNIALLGMIAPFFYHFIWIIGGALTPDYSHIVNDVSSLMSVGAPYKTLFDAMNITSSALTLVFAIGLYWYVNKGNGIPWISLGFGLQQVLVFIVALFYPLDAGGEMITPAAHMHLNLVLLMGLTNMVGMVAMWRSVKKLPEWNGYARYTIVTFIAMLATYGIAMYFIGTPFMGLTERFVAIVPSQYFFMTAMKVYKTE